MPRSICWSVQRNAAELLSLALARLWRTALGRAGAATEPLTISSSWSSRSKPSSPSKHSTSLVRNGLPLQMTDGFQFGDPGNRWSWPGATAPKSPSNRVARNRVALRYSSELNPRDETKRVWKFSGDVSRMTIGPDQSARTLANWSRARSSIRITRAPHFAGDSRV